MTKKSRRPAKSAAQLKQARQLSEKLNLLIRTAALTVDPQGRIEAVAEKSGLKSPAIRVAIRRGYFTVGQAAALELAFGADLLPRKKLAPQAKFA